MKYLIRGFIGLAVLVVFAFWFIFLSPRPVLTIDPAVLAGDGSVLDYCQMPVLDGSGKGARDIAKGNTPGCLYHHFPLPVLAACTAPLAAGVKDLRGLWQEIGGKHVERIEQCGARIVITSSGIIHDMGPNSTAGETSNDTRGTMFRIGGKAFCPRTSAGTTWSDDGKLELRIFGWGPVVVRRYLEGDTLVWEYPTRGTTRMKRLCKLPPSEKHPSR